MDNLRFDELSRTNQLESQNNYCLKNETIYSNIDSNSQITPTVDNDDALMDSCWPMKSQNRRHTGHSPYSTMDNNGLIKWMYETEGRIEEGIVIDDKGVLYFGDFNYFLYAINPDGTLKWKFKTDGKIWSTPALASDGTIYIGTYDDYLYAINNEGEME